MSHESTFLVNQSCIDGGGKHALSLEKEYA